MRKQWTESIHSTKWRTCELLNCDRCNADLVVAGRSYMTHGETKNVIVPPHSASLRSDGRDSDNRCAAFLFTAAGGSTFTLQGIDH